MMAQIIGFPRNMAGRHVVSEPTQESLLDLPLPPPRPSCWTCYAPASVLLNAVLFCGACALTEMEPHAASDALHEAEDGWA